MLGFGRRRLPAIAGLLLSAGTIGLMAVPAQATAATDTWVGTEATGSWQSGSDWGGTAPASGDFLYFGPLSGCDSATAACYDTSDDLGADFGISGLEIDSGHPYQLTPASGTDSLTITTSGGYGVISSPLSGTFAFPVVSIPIQLGDSQAWLVSGGETGSPLQVDSVDDGGNGYGLTVDLNSGNLYTGNVQTGQLTLEGDGNLYAENNLNPGDADVVLSGGGTGPEAGASGDGINIDASSSLYIESPGATSGPIDASAGNGNTLYIGSRNIPEAGLTVGGTGDVTLNDTATITFAIDGNDITPGLDASELSATNVDLAGATLSIDQGYGEDGTSCDTLTPGKAFTLISATSTLSGDLYYTGTDSNSYKLDPGNAATVPISINNDCSHSGTDALAYITYGQNDLTATIAGAPSSTQAPTIAGTAQVGQTVSTTNGSWTAYPAPTYAYQWIACASGSSCTPISGATGSSFVVTSAQEGDTIEVQVTATNSLGQASATSSATGAVPTPSSPNPTPSPTLAPTPTPSPAATLPSAAQVRAALNGIAHPTGSRALAALIRSHSYKASFKAPSAGSLRVTWTTAVTTGTGKHKKHKTVTVASGSGTATAAGKISITMHLTAAGSTLLKRKPHDLHITAIEKFRPTGGSWAVVTKHFTL